MEILYLVEILEEIHSEVQGMITSPYLSTTLLYKVSRWWSTYLDRFVVELSSEDVVSHRSTVPLFLEPILL